MNKRILNRILKLREDGLGMRDTLKLVIEMSKNSDEAAGIIMNHFMPVKYLMEDSK